MVKQTVRCVWHDSVGSMLPGCTEREKYLVSVSPAPADGTAPAARLSNKGARPSSPEANFISVHWQKKLFHSDQVAQLVSCSTPLTSIFCSAEKDIFFASQPPSRTWSVETQHHIFVLTGKRKFFSLLTLPTPLF